MDGRADLADFIEEQRSAIRQLKPAFFARIGSGKGALFVSEQFGFKKGVRQRGTAHLD